MVLGAADMASKGLARSVSCPGVPQQVSATMRGSASYSFGKPQHGKGHFKIPGVDKRSTYLGIKDTVGVGTYDLLPSMGREGNLECRKSAKHSFGLSTTVRDPTMRRFVENSMVTSTSDRDTPGPGRYLGIGLNLTNARTQPSYSMSKQLGRGVRYFATVGPDHYYTENKQNIMNARNAPVWKFGTSERDKDGPGVDPGAGALFNRVSTTFDVGPGKYDHATCMVSQFQKETKRDTFVAPSDVPKRAASLRKSH